AEDGQARPFRGPHDLAAHMPAAPKLTPMLGFLLVHDTFPSPLSPGGERGEFVISRRPAGERLALFAANLFAFVHDSLALVRLRLADGTHFGGKLANLLLVRPLDHDRVHIGALDR